MTTFEDILEAQKSIADSLGQRMSEFESQLRRSPDRQSSASSIDRLESEFMEFKKSVFYILDLLKSLTMNLATQIDDIDNRARGNALLFHGVKESDDESLVSIITNTLQETMGLSNIHSTTIQYCQRIGVKSDNKIRPVLVRFNDLNVRALIWSNKKKLKSSPVSVSEFLTKSRQAIFLMARKHFGISNSWTNNGIVYVKLPNNDRKRVTDREFLDGLIEQFPKNTDSSPSDVPAVELPSNKDSLQRGSVNKVPERSKRVTPSSYMTGTRRNAAKKL